MPLTDPFQPPLLLKGAMLQSLLASSRLRTLGRNPMKRAATQRILTSRTGVRLLGALSVPSGRHPKALVILLHGWEGSIDSTYVLQTGNVLFNRNYAIYRINLRDHGASHHLNQGLFYATFMEEVFDAVSQAASEMKGLPLFLVGFSLGGNFALRIARHSRQHPIDGLRHVAAISPVLDPDKATDCIDNNYFLKHYFLRKWLRSLKLKQSLFPDHYDFSDLPALGNVRSITDRLVPRHTEFKNSQEYFQGYTFTGPDFADIMVPTTIIAAKDDPVIPISDFMEIKLNSNIRLVIHSHGGHNGFVESMLLSSWYERKLSELFDKAVADSRLPHAI